MSGTQTKVLTLQQKLAQLWRFDPNFKYQYQIPFGSNVGSYHTVKKRRAEPYYR